MNILINDTKKIFTERFGKEAEWITAAPGRVNLIGEHTDYNDGFVFPMAIERYTVIAAGKSLAAESTVFSVNKSESVNVLIDGSAKPADTVTWSGYVQGTLQNCVENGAKLQPFNAVINSNVPLGGGLSSSASLEVAAATLAEVIAGHRFEPVQKALLCQKAEHEYAKMPCGIMDQFISALGQKGCAMLLDCRSRMPKMIPLDDPAVSVLIVNSNVKHELTGSEYPDRRRQCEKAAKLLGVPFLRDATLPQLESAKPVFDKEPDGGVCYRRAKHVITENDRTVAAAEALAKRDWKTAGRLMYESHASMRDDFEITVSEIDILADIARRLDGVIGSRMTGGGFGGCTVSLIESSKESAITEAINKEYTTATGIKPTIFATTAAQGSCAIK
ncbi:MAG: galactokinase [Planctomycetaceae bacterium]|jgi:galactokinase|nr:galactokinase [Planctomycetaceae bacterium]